MFYFFGSDCFSSFILKKLNSNFPNRISVIVPPISRTGRALKNIYQPPLLKLANELELPTHILSKPAKPGENPLKEWSFDLNQTESEQDERLLITASFPYMVPKKLIDQFGQSRALNVHPSLLPMYRGAAPIQWQIAHRQPVGGITIQDLSPIGFDRGRILAQHSLPLAPNISYAQAEHQLAKLAATSLLNLIHNLPHAILNAQPQDESKATHAPKITSLDLRIHAWMTKEEVEARYRGMGHQYPLSIQVDSEVYHLTTEFSEVPSADVRQWAAGVGATGDTGQVVFDRVLDVAAITLPGAEGADRVLVVNQLKRAAPGAKGWQRPSQWFDRLANQAPCISRNKLIIRLDHQP